MPLYRFLWQVQLVQETVRSGEDGRVGVWGLVQSRSAEKRWFRLRGYRRLGEVIENVRFVNGVRDDEVAA